MTKVSNLVDLLVREGELFFLVVEWGCRCKAQIKKLGVDLHKLTLPEDTVEFFEYLLFCIISCCTNNGEGKYRE